MNTKNLVWLRIFLYTVVSLATAWQTTMNGVNWEGLDWVEQSCLFAGITVLWFNTMIAFFDKSVWKADAEKQNGSNNTQAPK